MAKSAEVDFSPVAPERRAGRFALDSARTMECADMERVGYGVERNARPGVPPRRALVFESGQTQAAIPVHAVSTAVASGKVIPLDALAAALHVFGNVADMRKALDKVDPPA